MSKKMSGNLMLLTTALVWGLSFVSQTVGMDLLGPFTFAGTRYLLGSLVLIPVMVFRDKKGLSTLRPKNKQETRYLLLSGLLCGTLLFAASSLQQIALQFTTAGKAAFISTLYILLVPFAGLFFRQKVHPVIWVSIVLALVGMFLLCGGEQFSIGPGEILCLFCALGFTAHIVAVGRISPKVDGVRLSSLQFFVCSAFSAVFMFTTEAPRMDHILKSWMPICYSGLLSAGVGYTLQVIGQARTEPTIASLLMSLESVFAAIFGWLLLNQIMGIWEIVGCLLMFAAVILAQVPIPKIFSNNYPPA